MPLDEDGAKWSCEPCVRGHRSSKCQHFDRLMMKVPKAGRPLAKCPHPKGTCSCQKLYAFMLRIPKGSSCLCRPLYQVPMVVMETGEMPQATQSHLAAPPPAPTAVAGPNRVQKRPRRRSSLQAVPEVVAKALNIAAPSQHHCEATKVNGQSQPNCIVDSPYISRYPSRGDPISIQAHQSTLAAVPKPAQNGCCSTNPMIKDIPQPDSYINIEDPHHEQLATSENGLNGKGNELSLSPFSKISSYPAAGPGPPWERMYGQPMHISCCGTAETGSVSENIMTSVWLPSSAPASPRSYSSRNFHQSTTSGRLLPGQYFPADSNERASDVRAIPGGNPCHDCPCGDSCECFGCPSHPYNATTRQRMQEIGYLITHNDEPDTFDGPEDRSDPFFKGQMISTISKGIDHGSFPARDPALASGSQVLLDNMETPVSPTRENGHSTSTEPDYDPSYREAVMLPAAYYTVEYPAGFLDPCTNLTGTCQCSAECSCIGCLTHAGHDGVGLEPPPPTNQISAPMGVLDEFVYTSIA